ncbi:thioredoxin-like protein 4B [Exaiptasia diaphana]|uniref:Thioredoxin-like protein n=1 Tax=Exaiptasia diaphana TaxID=2652724 RepID=A0A913YCG8_EXADI|nr:thioredoxin-like protein 4B [Exaiptasia diaphana]KXJ19398.1 Thioredoxin-like protein 4B [Exaiptasia diaphana]
MSYLLTGLKQKKDVDNAIKNTEDKVLVLRFGREKDLVCMQLDDILAKSSQELSRMADIYKVEVDDVPVYTKYFDITLIPATIFFFNGQHIKVDYGTPDHTKFIGSFKTKQDFIDVVEVVLRGATRGKLIVTSPLDPRNVPKYNLLYKDI